MQVKNFFVEPNARLALTSMNRRPTGMFDKNASFHLNSNIGLLRSPEKCSKMQV